MPKKDATVTLQIVAQLRDAEKRDDRPQAVAYAFSSSGRPLAQAELDAKGSASLSVPASDEAQAVRVLIGPPLEQEAPSIAELTRRGAEERRLRIDPDTRREKLEIVVLPERWLCWLLSRCTVRGTLHKRVTSGGVTLDLPVCNATVEVYEVDPLYVILPKLPDRILDRFRDILVNPPLPDPPFPPEPPEPFPPEPPGPFPPGPFPPGPGPGPGPFAARVTALGAGRELAAARSETRRTISAPAAESVPETLRFVARNAGLEQFRAELLRHPELVRPLLCRFFPQIVTMELVATAVTDDCGRFRAVFFRGCGNPDTPDLYFRAKQRILPPPFPPVTIYAPTPIACHTRWNYACGTEVALITDHPLARTCLPCPPVDADPNWVLVMAVGNHPLSRIHGTGEALQATTTPTNLGLTDGGAPWGGLLRLRLEFDADLRQSLGVRYYRVSWRKGSSGAFAPLDGEVVRHYTHEVGGDLVLEVYPLGPKVVGSASNLFEIPPALPPVGQWSLPDVVEDTTSAKFPTTVHVPAVEAGKVQLKVDLFDTAGNPVDIAAKAIRYVVPTSTDLSGTVYTTNAADLGLVSGNSFIMTLHVDNNVCSAVIDPPTRSGVAADPNCGVIEYDPASPGSVVMPYTGSHPNGFATHRFRVVRGVTPVVNVTGPAPGSSSVTETVSDLLGGCTVAGFSENLHVWAMATTGWRRLREYDAHAVRAFVLAPEEETP